MSGADDGARPGNFRLPERGLFMAVLAALLGFGLVVAVGINQGIGASVLVATSSGVLGGILGLVALAAQRAEESSVRVFISYNHDNEEIARTLAERMSERRGISVNTQDSLPLGANLRRALSHELAISDAMLVLVAQSEPPSEWVSWELDVAKNLGLPIVPVRFTPPGQDSKTIRWGEIADGLKDRVGVDLDGTSDGYSHAVDRIIRALKEGEVFTS